MTVFQAALLGLLQGLSEFLPISSSGHLVLGQALLGIRTGNVTFEVIVHFGTVLAVLTVLRGRVVELLRGTMQGEASARRTVTQILVATLPAAAVGLLFEESLEAAFADPRAVSVCLLATGIVLWLSVRFRAERAWVGWADAIWMGAAQAMAVLPGISRSGMTIGMGMCRGVQGGEAAVFSFLLAIPVIAGATSLEVGELVAADPEPEVLLPLAVGLATAYGSGVLAIRWLLGILRRGRFDRFAYYCWAVGGAGLAWFG